MVGQDMQLGDPSVDGYRLQDRQAGMIQSWISSLKLLGYMELLYVTCEIFREPLWVPVRGGVTKGAVMVGEKDPAAMSRKWT